MHEPQAGCTCACEMNYMALIHCNASKSSSPSRCRISASSCVHCFERTCSCGACAPLGSHVDSREYSVVVRAWQWHLLHTCGHPPRFLLSTPEAGGDVLDRKFVCLPQSVLDSLFRLFHGNNAFWLEHHKRPPRETLHRPIQHTRCHLYLDDRMRSSRYPWVLVPKKTSHQIAGFHRRPEYTRTSQCWAM